MTTHWTLNLLACVALTTLAGAQEDRSQAIKLTDLTLETYQPSHTRVQDLYEASAGFSSRYISIDGRSGAPVSNMSLMSGRIVLYDTPENVRRIVAALRQLDVPDEAIGAGSDEYVTRSYTPRNISVSAAGDALKPLRNHLRSGAQNYVEVEHRMLTLRDTADRVDEMEALLRSVDVPEDQITITCYLLRGNPTTDGASDTTAVPSVLIQNLKSLLPGTTFESIGFAMAQSSVSPGRSLSLSVQAVDQARYNLGFAAVAYDNETGNLTARDCQVLKTEEATSQQEASARMLLDIDTVFRGGEYTVLGASGVRPVFVVVRVQSRQ